jgi:two-component system, NtrC family, sensor kinase
MNRSSNAAQKSGSNIRDYFKQLERRFQFGLVMAFFIPLVALSIYFHIQFDVTLKETGKLNLAAIAESQRNTVDLFLQERLVNIFSLFHSREFALSPSKQQMMQFLLQLRQASDAFIDVGFLNADGVQAGYAGPFPYLQNKDYSAQEWFHRLLQSERNYFISDIYFGFRNKLHFTIAASQVIDGRVYVLRATLDPDKFYLFLRTINHGKGVESFIVNTDGRFQLADPLKWQALSVSPFVLPTSLASGVHEIGRNGDSQLVAHAWLKETTWALVVSEPIHIAYSQFYRARRIMLISTAVVTVVFISAIWLATRSLIGKARENAEKREELYRQLLHASKMASLGELATGVAHEINNPLAIIMATAGVIKDRLNPEFNIDGRPEAILEELKTIDMAVMRAKKITQQLLNYGRKTEPKLEKTDVNSILNEVLSGVKARELQLANITLERDLESNLPEIMVDRDQVRQVMVNLLNNASDAMQGPGRITVKSCVGNGDIRVTIMDTGHGMDAEQINKIFDPFFTTKEVGKGTGLGLSVSLGIIESMGGTISVQSMPGAGSAFTVILPADNLSGVKNDG